MSVETQTDEVYIVKTVSVETQTDKIHVVKTISASTETDEVHVVTVMSASTQTDKIELKEPRTHTGVELELNPDEDFILCEGNNDEKFHPLIVKHKGIFRDVTG